MDFRGRVYPLPPYLNHMGNDLAKALLVFARGKPLGPHGLQWLKLHCINLTGLKKRDSVQERLQYADNNLNLILDTAEKRLDGERWFLESDEPWLTFSVCNEIKAALEHPGGPENYVSHLPIHQVRPFVMKRDRLKNTHIIIIQDLKIALYHYLFTIKC